jgi:hypothetical protein
MWFLKGQIGATAKNATSQKSIKLNMQIATFNFKAIQPHIVYLTKINISNYKLEFYLYVRETIIVSKKNAT